MKNINAIFGAALLASVAALPAWGQNINVTGSITAAGQISGGGSTTNDNACTGCIGELIQQTSFVTSAPLLVTSVPAIATQVLLTAGDWDCGASAQLIPNSVTSVTLFSAWTSTANASAPPPLPTITTTNLNPSFVGIMTAALVSPTWALGVPRVRYSLSASTSVYLLVDATFTASSATGAGVVQCRRAR
jgi:hypothetical protein